MIYKCMNFFCLFHKFLYSMTCYFEGYLSENFILKFITVWLLYVKIATNAVGQGHVIRVAGKHGSILTLLHRPIQILSCSQFIPDITSTQGM